MNAETKMEPDRSSVYAKIAIVQGALAKHGIGKNNQAQGYKFRGIDDVYNALAPLLAEHRLCVLPRMLAREIAERTTGNGKPLFFVTVEAEFDFVSADDGSTHTVRTFGEAMDMSDKATNKAMSAAYKYAAFMTFAIPTEGDNDADATSHDIAAKPQQEAPPRTNWGGRYPNKTALHRGLSVHQAELRRIGDEGVMDDLETYLTSPEYYDFLKQAGEHAKHYLEGGPPAPEEFIGCYALETRARDMIALRGNQPAEREAA